MMRMNARSHFLKLIQQISMNVRQQLTTVMGLLTVITMTVLSPASVERVIMVMVCSVSQLVSVLLVI